MIARKSALIFLNTIVGGILGFIAIKSIAVGFNSLEAVGRFSYALGTLGLIFFVTDMGFGVAHAKRVSEGENESDCLATFAVFKLVATSVFVLAATGLYVFMYVVRGEGFQDIALTAYAIIIVFYVSQAARSVFVATFDARREPARSQLSLFVDTLVRVIVTVAAAGVFMALAYQMGPLVGLVSADVLIFRLIAHYPAGAIAATYAAGAVASVIVAVWQWRKSGIGMGRFRWDILKSYWQFALPLFLLMVVSGLASNVDRAALGYFGVAQDPGLYELPRRVITLLDAVPVAVATLLFPTISKLNADGAHVSVRDTSEAAIRYVSMIVLPVVVFVAVFAGPIISIVLTDTWLAGGAAILALLAVYTYFTGLLRAYSALAIGLGRSAVLAKVGILMALSNIFLNVLLIPTDIRSLGITLPGLGATGAALATLISGVLGFAYMWLTVGRLGTGVRARGVARHLLAGGIMALAMLALDSIHEFVRWYDAFLFAAFGGVVYLLALVATREFTRRDWDFFLGLANVREMVRYVRKELFHK